MVCYGLYAVLLSEDEAVKVNEQLRGRRSMGSASDDSSPWLPSFSSASSLSTHLDIRFFDLELP